MRFMIRSGQAFPETHVEVRGHSKWGRRREKGGQRMMKWRKEELRWWPLAPRLPFLFHSLIRSLCFFSHSSHWLFVSSADLTAGRDLGDLSRGQLAAMAAEGSVWGLGSSLGQHQWCVQDPEATKMVSSKSRSCVYTSVSYFWWWFCVFVDLQIQIYAAWKSCFYEQYNDCFY